MSLRNGGVKQRGEKFIELASIFVECVCTQV
jgi:hypothetical protein